MSPRAAAIPASLQKILDSSPYGGPYTDGARSPALVGGNQRDEPIWSPATDEELREETEELDLPVGLHMGPGPPGGIYIGQTDYRARLSSALLLEAVLVRHPSAARFLRLSDEEIDRHWGQGE